MALSAVRVAVCGSVVLLLALSACGGKRHAAAVVPTNPWTCPGDHPIKVISEGSTLGPWVRGYAQTRTVACYDSEANAAKAGLLVPVTNK